MAVKSVRPTPAAPSSVKQRILDVAEALAQKRGFNGFSYADIAEKLRRYVALYDSVMRNDRMCLCGMLAAEFATLPRPMQDALRVFFDANEVWLAAVLEQGAKDGTLVFRGPAKQRACMILGALEGAMLVARAYGDGPRFLAAAEHVLDDLGAEPGENRWTIGYGPINSWASRWASASTAAKSRPLASISLRM